MYGSYNIIINVITLYLLTYWDLVGKHNSLLAPFISRPIRINMSLVSPQCITVFNNSVSCPCCVNLCHKALKTEFVL